MMNGQLTIKRTHAEDRDFLELVKALDLELAVRDGDQHSFYDQFNKTEKIKHVVVAYQDGLPIGCGAVKEYSPDTMEVKRMYILPDKRRKGIASLLLKELETWCRELNYRKCILETGKQQPEAIELYRKNKYRIIPNFGQYAHVDNSVCFLKALTDIS